MSLAGSITDLSSEWINPRSSRHYTYHARDEAPLVSKITVSCPDSEGIVSITGAPGAVPELAGRTGKDSIRIATVEWGTQTCVRYNSDGSFSASLPAGDGTTIVLGATGAHCEGQWIDSPSSVFLRVPDGIGDPGDAVQFSISSQEWSATGQLAGSSPYIEVTLAERRPCVVPRLHVYRLFDEEGQYAGQVNLNVHGPVMTPTGLPIETRFGPRGYWALVKPITTGELSTEQCPAGFTARYELGDWTADLIPGWYTSRVVLYGVRPDDSEFIDGSLTTNLDGIEGNTDIGYLPLLNVGNALTPRIPATLLNERPSWGSGGIRGVVANEDEGRFALGSRRAAQGPFIASPQDPLSGRRLSYLLEPFLPTMAYTGFNYVQPQVPLIFLDQSSPGVLSGSLTKPDGEVEVLAEDARIIQSFISGSGVGAYPVELSFAGPGRTYGITTGLDSFDIEFDQYGLHTVSLSGTLRTLWGQELLVQGTYDIWVAEPLDLSLGTFEGTPLEVGDEWSPVVVIEPGVPANVEISVEHYVDGDPTKKQSFRTSGQANRFGYFVADDTWTPERHGEYIVRVTATYEDPVDGSLWMGTRAGASIVATPDTPLIAHGEKDKAIARVIGDDTLRPWFILRQFEIEPIGFEYPFFRGDVAWLEDGVPIGPTITLQDPTGILEDIAPQVASSRIEVVIGEGPVELPDMKRLSMQTAEGKGGQHRKDAIDSWAYWYTSSIRPDISIHHTVSEEDSNHNHWYGTDTYNCQIGLTCFGAWQSIDQGGRTGDEEGDVKLLFGGAVIKGGGEQHFVPYASMAVIVPETIEDPETGEVVSQDSKGSRLCPPYQGAAAGLATCGPILTIRDREVDLFVTPMGTRPGSVLEVGDRFVFSGQAWPTLDVAVAVTVTSPSGKVRSFSGRASQVGYIDGEEKTFVVDEQGIYTVHVALTQDRPVPATGVAPDPPIVADGQTLLDEYGYVHPLSAILGSTDSTYRFFVAEPLDEVSVDTAITLKKYFQDQFTGHRVPREVSITFNLPSGAEPVWQTVTIPGLVIRDKAVSGSPSQVTILLDRDELYAQGYTSVVLGADSMEITLVGTLNGEWFAKALNLRGVSPLGGSPATITYLKE